MKASVYSDSVTVHVNRLESCPLREQVLVSPVSVSMIWTLSTAVSPSVTVGDASVGV